MLNTTTSRPKTITLIIVMLLVLALVSTVSLATTRIGFGGRGNRTGNTPGQSGGNFQGNNNGNAQGNNGGEQTESGGTSGNFQRGTQSGFNLFSITRSLGLNPQVFVYVNLGLSIAGILLLLLSVYGIWKQKIWGLNLATLLGLIFLIGAVPGFFSFGGRNINWIRIGSTVLSTVAALPILGLSFLPSVRDYFPKSKPKPRLR
ncbi:MAG: hypothetical protein NTW32_14245 [Chloroflexi bacterium]|nr:hypothetical protein [Chloroflexota bacterium]